MMYSDFTWLPIGPFFKQVCEALCMLLQQAVIVIGIFSIVRIVGAKSNEDMAGSQRSLALRLGIAGIILSEMTAVMLWTVLEPYVPTSARLMTRLLGDWAIVIFPTLLVALHPSMD